MSQIHSPLIAGKAVSPSRRLSAARGRLPLRMLQCSKSEALRDSRPFTCPGQNFNRISLQALYPASLQPKLAINPTGDYYEQEADRVAEQVMCMTLPPNETTVSNSSDTSTRHQCACGAAAGDTCESESCRRKRLQRKTQHSESATQSSSFVPPIVHEVLRSPGEPLDRATRDFFESRFGHDFKQVRVHTNSQAAESARMVNALAYTVGSDIVFGTRRFAPGNCDGRRLVAHELAHVVQQNGIHNSLHRQTREEDNENVVAQDPDEEDADILSQGPQEMTDAKKKPKKTPKKMKPKKSTLDSAQILSYITANNNAAPTVSTELLLCLIWKESGFHPELKNSTSTATGLMQVTKPAVVDVNANTPKGVHFDFGEMVNPQRNIACGTYYLQLRIDRVGGDVKKGLEGYGTGSGYADNIQTCENCVRATPPDLDACLHAVHP